MGRTKDPGKAEQARQLELSGLSRKAVAAEMGVTARTVSRWLGPLPPGRPRVADDAASERTRYRRRAG